MKTHACSYCGGDNHNSLTCYKKRKKDHAELKRRAPLRRESKAHASKRAILYNTFFANNPPDELGGYTCYLQISKYCPKWLSQQNVTLEHVLPRSKFPELRWVSDNIKPACEFCNKTKMSNTVEKLSLFWPHLKDMMETPEWKAWEAQIAPFLNRPVAVL